MMKTCALGFCVLATMAFAKPTANLASGRTRMVPAGTDPRLLSAISKANSEFEIAMTKRDTATIVEPYTTDAVFVSPDGTAANGRARIEQLYRDRFEKSGPTLEARIDSEQLMVDGDLAYERGSGVLTRLEKGKHVSSSARFLTIWQRLPDGDWKILRNIVLPGR